MLREAHIEGWRQRWVWAKAMQQSCFRAADNKMRCKGSGGAYMREGGREGMGSKPCTSLREVPTRALKALPNTLLATRGDPNVMHRMSASGYSSAAHAAPVAWQSIS